MDKSHIIIITLFTILLLCIYLYQYDEVFYSTFTKNNLNNTTTILPKIFIF